MTKELYNIMLEAKMDNRKIMCNATQDTSLKNIINMLKKGLSEIYDEKGRKIVLKGKNELIY